MSDLSKVKTKLVTITPEECKKHLDHTQRNIDAGAFRQRPTTESFIRKYERDIKLGMWLASPQTVSLDVNGNVIDGRHRLMAIIRAGVPVVVNFSTGWPVTQKCGQLVLNTIDGMDAGRVRSNGSRLHIGHDLPNANYYAAIAKTVAEVCCDAKHVGVTVPQLLLILEIYQQSAETIRKIAADTRKSVSYICGPLAFMHQSEPEKVEAFADKFFQLEGLSAGHPALALVKWVQHHPRAASQDRHDTAKVVLSSLQAFCEGRKLSKVYVSQSAWLWATALQKDNVRKVRQIIGVK